MQLITFDPYRTLSYARTEYIKPELMNHHLDRLIAADGILFPQYWQVNALLYGLKKRIFPSPASYYMNNPDTHPSALPEAQSLLLFMGWKPTLPVKLPASSFFQPPLTPDPPDDLVRRCLRGGSSFYCWQA